MNFHGASRDLAHLNRLEKLEKGKWGQILDLRRSLGAAGKKLIFYCSRQCNSRLPKVNFHRSSRDLPHLNRLGKLEKGKWCSILDLGRSWGALGKIMIFHHC